MNPQKNTFWSRHNERLDIGGHKVSRIRRSNSDDTDRCPPPARGIKLKKTTVVVSGVSKGGCLGICPARRACCGDNWKVIVWYQLRETLISIISLKQCRPCSLRWLPAESIFSLRKYRCFVIDLSPISQMRSSAGSFFSFSIPPFPGRVTPAKHKHGVTHVLKFKTNNTYDVSPPLFVTIFLTRQMFSKRKKN